jgi:hypothetical protein
LEHDIIEGENPVFDLLKGFVIRFPRVGIGNYWITGSIDDNPGDPMLAQERGMEDVKGKAEEDNTGNPIFESSSYTTARDRVRYGETDMIDEDGSDHFLSEGSDHFLSEVDISNQRFDHFFLSSQSLLEPKRRVKPIDIDTDEDFAKEQWKDNGMSQPSSGPPSFSPNRNQPISRNIAELSNIDDGDLDDIINSLYEIHVKKSMHSSSLTNDSIASRQSRSYQNQHQSQDHNRIQNQGWTKITEHHHDASHGSSYDSNFFDSNSNSNSNSNSDSSRAKPFEHPFSPSLSDAYELPM